jgi:hypothetical protein
MKTSIIEQIFTATNAYLNEKSPTRVRARRLIYKGYIYRQIRLLQNSGYPWASNKYGCLNRGWSY